jgi:hypothetical protein
VAVDAGSPYREIGDRHDNPFAFGGDPLPDCGSRVGNEGRRWQQANLTLEPAP